MELNFFVDVGHDVCDYLNGVDMFQVSVKMMERIKFNTYDAFNHESE